MNTPFSLKTRIIAPLSLLFLLLATGLAGGSLWHTRDFTQRQLAQHAQDAATTLSLRLAPHITQGDVAALTSNVDALFDSGAFEHVRINDARGEQLLERRHTLRVQGVPAKFIAHIELAAPAGLADISDAWRIVGQVMVTSHTGLAYRQLWHTTLVTLALALAGWLLASLLVVVALGASLRPLSDMEALARRVATGEFPRLKRTARVRELRNIGIALDDMSQALARMLEEKARLIAGLETELNRDPVTGLVNRRALLAALDAALASRDATPKLLLIGRIAGFAEYNRGLGRAAGDRLLAELAATWSAHAAGGLPARLDGPQIALMLEAPDTGAARVLAESLANVGQQAAAASGLDFHVGAAYSAELSHPSTWLTRADAALRQAERSEGGGHILLDTPDSDARYPELAGLLETGALTLDLQDVVACADGTVLAREALARLTFQGTRHSISPWLGEARASGLLARMDRLALTAAVEAWLSEFPATLPISVNLDPASLLQGEAAEWLAALPLHYPEMRGRLLLELPFDALRARGLEAALQTLRARGIGLVADRFMLAPGALDVLTRLRPDWVKLDGSLIRAAQRSSGNQMLLASICGYARGLKIRTCACGVESAQLRLQAETSGCDAVQGYAVAAPVAAQRDD